MTDGGLYRADDGQEFKRFHARDGLGLRLLQNGGLQIAVITGRTSDVVRHRCEELDIEHVFQGCKDKLPAFQTLLERTGLSPSEVAYMGDDIIDLPVMRRVGLALTVPDATAEIASIAHWTSTAKGGNGAVREACEFLLRSTGAYASAIAKYQE